MTAAARPFEADQIDAARFFSHVLKSANCWLWTAALDRDGYGRLTQQINGVKRDLRAHRVSFALDGNFIDQRPLDHLCRVRRCVNPKHLELVTLRENTRRGFALNGLSIRRREVGLCTNGHVLAEVGTHKGHPGGARACAECGRNRVRRYNARLLDRLSGIEAAA